MPNMIDPFTADGFTTTNLTTRVNRMDRVPGFLGRLINWNNYGVDTYTVQVEEKDTTLGLIQTSERGAPGPVDSNDKRNIRSFVVPHIKKSFSVNATEVQGIRAFGSTMELETVDAKVMEKVNKVLTEHRLTLENHRLGAVSGIIKDADGSTIANLFNEFGVAAPADVDFLLGTATTKILEKCMQIRDTMADAIRQPGNNGDFEIHAVCGKTFHQRFINHDNVKTAFERWQGATGYGAFLRETNMHKGFPFGDITWHRYWGNQAGSVKVPDGDVRFFAPDLPIWETAYAPADIAEAVNTIGLPVYVVADPFGNNNSRRSSWEVQSNPFNFCTEPGHLIRGHSSN